MPTDIRVIPGNDFIRTDAQGRFFLPALAVGTWVGLKLFGKLDDQAFRRVVLVLLLISGASDWRTAHTA